MTQFRHLSPEAAAHALASIADIDTREQMRSALEGAWDDGFGIGAGKLPRINPFELIAKRAEAQKVSRGKSGNIPTRINR